MGRILQGARQSTARRHSYRHRNDAAGSAGGAGAAPRANAGAAVRLQPVPYCQPPGLRRRAKPRQERGAARAVRRADRPVSWSPAQPREFGRGFSGPAFSFRADPPRHRALRRAAGVNWAEPDGARALAVRPHRRGELCRGRSDGGLQRHANAQAPDQDRDRDRWLCRRLFPCAFLKRRQGGTASVRGCAPAAALGPGFHGFDYLRCHRCAGRGCAARRLCRASRRARDRGRSRKSGRHHRLRSADLAWARYHRVYVDE